MEVNLRYPLHADNKPGKQGMYTGFENQSRHHQKSKPMVPVAPKKGTSVLHNF